MIANIARYHRKADPAKDQVEYQAMAPQDRRTMAMLSAILRIADGLDRSHFSVVQNLHAILGKTVTIQLDTFGDSELEVWTAQGRAQLFEKIFKRKVKFLAHAKKAGIA